MEQSQPAEPEPSGASDQPRIKPEAQPVEPGVPPEAGVPPSGPVKRRRSWKMVLLVVASVLGVLCSGTVGYGLWWYNQETKPDRSAPDVVVDSYLRSFLVEKDPTVTSMYICDDPSGLVPLTAFLADVEAREQQHHISIRITWSALNSEVADSRAVVTTNIKRAISDNSESIVETWEFGVEDQSGWRVCSARKVQ